MSDDSHETLRLPTNLDHAAILERLAKLRDGAAAAGLESIAARFADLPAMNPARIGAAVVASLNDLEGRAEHRLLANQLEIVALNLKNLK